MTTQTQVWTLFFATATLTGIVLSACIYGIWLIRDKMRAWLIIQDEDGGMAEVRRISPRDGKVVVKRRGTDPRLFILNAKGRKTTNRGGLYTVDAVSGSTLAAPDRATWAAVLERAKEEGQTVLAKMQYLTPDHAFHVLKTQVAQDFLRAREEREHWIVRIAPLMLIALVVMVGTIGFLVWKMSKTQGVA